MSLAPRIWKIANADRITLFNDRTDQQVIDHPGTVQVVEGHGGSGYLDAGGYRSDLVTMPGAPPFMVYVNGTNVGKYKSVTAWGGEVVLAGYVRSSKFYSASRALAAQPPPSANRAAMRQAVLGAVVDVLGADAAFELFGEDVWELLSES